jgi:putative transposase
MRLPEYDYSQPGYYFITICIKDRAHILGSVKNGKMLMNQCGKIVQRCWRNLPKHYRCILDEFVVMPNHIHAIIEIPENVRKNVAVGLKPTATLKQHSISEIIRALKTFSAREINTICKTKNQPVWQKGFYDHIVRAEEDLYMIRIYIQTNPANWEKDRNNL